MQPITASLSYSILKWLYKSGCIWNTHAIALQLLGMSQKGEQRLLMLQWLEQLPGSPPLGQWHKAVLLFDAGMFSNLKAAEYLLAQGAEWPKSFTAFGWHGAYVYCTWPVSSARWALSQGYSWEGWRCQDVKATHPECREAAQALLTWAHSSEANCPCTYNDPEPAAAPAFTFSAPQLLFDQ